MAMLLSVAAAATALSPPATMAQRGSTRYVVNFTGRSVPPAAVARIRAAGGQLVRALPQVGLAIAVSGSPDFARTIRSVAGVASVGEVPVVSLSRATAFPVHLTPNSHVPDAPSGFWYLLWGIARVNAPAVWQSFTTGSHDTIVAVIDTGIASNHPDVAPNLVFNACFVSGGDHITGACTPYPSLSFHGTHVAATVAGNFGGGVVGVGPDLGVANYNVFEKMGDGDAGATFDSIWAAMLDAAQRGFDVINMSLGTVGSFPAGDAAFFTAQNRVANHVRQQGTFVVASSGNAGLNLNGPWFSFPADVPGILSVGATGIRPDPAYPQLGAFDVRAFYSNHGASVGIVAPGGDCGLPDDCAPLTRPANWLDYLILSAFVNPNPVCAMTQSCPVGYAYAGGTSMSAPHVSGVVGLVRDANPSLSPNQVGAILRKSAQDLGDRQQFGHGMVDAFQAVLLAQGW